MKQKPLRHSWNTLLGSTVTTVITNTLFRFFYTLKSVSKVFLTGSNDTWVLLTFTFTVENYIFIRRKKTIKWIDRMVTFYIFFHVKWPLSVSKNRILNWFIDISSFRLGLGLVLSIYIQSYYYCNSLNRFGTLNILSVSCPKQFRDFVTYEYVMRKSNLLVLKAAQGHRQKHLTVGL